MRDQPDQLDYLQATVNWCQQALARFHLVKRDQGAKPVIHRLFHVKNFPDSAPRSYSARPVPKGYSTRTNGRPGNPGRPLVRMFDCIEPLCGRASHLLLL
jgi:hypothetical protein